MKCGSRGPFGIVLRACVATAALPTLAATLAAFVLDRTQPFRADLAAPGAAASALALPFVVAAFACSLRAVRTWPLFALRQPGTDFVQRLQRGPWRGRGSAIAGALAAQLALTLPLALLLPGWLGAAPTARATVALTVLGSPRLDRTHPNVTVAAPADVEWQRLVLRPVAMLPEGPLEPTGLSLRVEGSELTSALEPVADTGQRVVADFPPRRFTRIEAVRTSGTLPLYFPPGSIEATAARGRSNRGNAAIAACLALLPSFFALALGALVGGVAARPTVTMVVASLLFVTTIGEVGPFGSAMRMVMRSEWLLSGAVFAAAMPLLALGSLAMAIAMMARNRHRA